jgi:hypothetical protein
MPLGCSMRRPRKKLLHRKKKGDPRAAQFLPTRTTTALSGRDKERRAHHMLTVDLYRAFQGTDALVLLPFPPQIGQLLRQR